MLALPHWRVLITEPGRTALGKRGLDPRPRGAGGVSERRHPRAAAATEGGRAAGTRRLKMAEDVLAFYRAARRARDWAPA